MLKDAFRLQIDLLGARAELATGLVSNWLLNRATPQGSGKHPVITFPGFLASDATLLRLNAYLNTNGFIAKSWGQGRNLGPQEKSWDKHLERLERKLGKDIRRLADKHSSRVSLIGQSLGGVYARELALLFPDYIDRVIMLGSPTFHPYMKARHNRVVSMFGYWLSRRSYMELAGRRGLLHWDADHPAMPCVSFHSPIDGVVDEASSIIPNYIVEQHDPKAPRENVRVFSTHVGMGVNPWVLLAIADRLAQDCADWKTFDPYQYFPDTLHWAVPLLYPPQSKAKDNPRLKALVEPA